MKIILASASPRRKELLERMGLDFEIRLAEHDETMDPSLEPEEAVRQVSLRKAEAVRPVCTARELILGADTVVVCDGALMGKPRDAADALRMLEQLSGREHRVITGLSLLRGEEHKSVSVTTAIRFRPLSREEILGYIATKEPMDKAGAYGIQGLASMFVSEIRGDYYNVMGLPVCTLTQLLREFGVKLLGC